MSVPIYITPKGLEKLKAELKELLHVERPQLVKTVAWAASNGDRSENADYIYGKRRLREIDKRAGWLAHRIEKATVVDTKLVKSDKVVFGAKVKVQDSDTEEVSEFQIVGEDEVNVELGCISWRSPIGGALLNKKVGDEVKVKRPVGDWYIEILSIEYI